MSIPDRQARFRELLERSHARWAGIARAYAEVRDRDDLLQEIALQVWQNLDRFAGRSTLDTWAYRVALNTGLAWRRKATMRTKKLTQSKANIAELPGDGGSEGDVQRVLDRFLTALSDGDRAVLLLHLDGLSHADAAEVLGISEGAYRTRLHRIRRCFEEAYC
ncbi:MAG TPA: RNA polymerase sigma factor [Gemmataceae bacterium]|nr:RNA polymerase sigma factor [Gemmataceae bacterium]